MYIQPTTNISKEDSSKKEQRVQMNSKYYWYPPWNTGALRRSLPLLLAPDFSKLFSRADSNEGRLTTGLWTENCFFGTPGLTDDCLFLPFPGLERLQHGSPSFSCSATYCTSPTSTTSETRTVLLGAPSPTADEATVSPLNHRSRVPFTAFLCAKTFWWQDFKSIMTGPAPTPIAPQGSKWLLCRTASAAVTALFNIPIPVSEKKLLWVKEGWQTKSCTQATAPFTLSWSIATPSSDTVNAGCTSDGPLTMSAVNWKI